MNFLKNAPGCVHGQVLGIRPEHLDICNISLMPSQANAYLDALDSPDSLTIGVSLRHANRQF